MAIDGCMFCLPCIRQADATAAPVPMAAHGEFPQRLRMAGTGRSATVESVREPLIVYERRTSESSRSRLRKRTLARCGTGGHSLGQNGDDERQGRLRQSAMHRNGPQPVRPDFMSRVRLGRDVVLPRLASV
jgi:hypothetical protein